MLQVSDEGLNRSFREFARKRGFKGELRDFYMDDYKFLYFTLSGNQDTHFNRFIEKYGYNYSIRPARLNGECLGEGINIEEKDGTSERFYDIVSKYGKKVCALCRTELDEENVSRWKISNIDQQGDWVLARDR